MDIMQIGTSLTIVILAYLVGLTARIFPSIKNEFIPVIVGIAGGLFGAVGMYVIPDFPASDIMTAIAVGIVSGLASTGVDQAIKQVRKIDFTTEK